ncbi:MAG: phosphodiester glycosidase family protein [Clostridia bacterium]|nr:phosphodiester glycosidase family protein [Clostridia bacterium]
MNYKPLDYFALYDEEMEEEEREERKTVLGVSFGFLITLISIAALAIVLFLTAISLRSYSFSGDAKKDAADFGLNQRFSTGFTNLQSDTLGDIYKMKKLYVIAENDVVVPKPDSDCFGTASSRDEIKKIYDSAEAYGLISADDSVFLKDKDWNGKEIKYYLDETILAVLWKSKYEGQTYNFAEVSVAHGSQFRRYLTGDRFGSVARDTTSSISKAINAVVGMSGDFYAYRDEGLVIYHRKLCRFKSSRLDACLVNSDGDLVLVGKKEFGTKDEFEKYIEDNDIIFSLSFGPILIKDGEIKKIGYYPIGQVNDNYARAAFAQVGTRHYLCCTVDGSVSLVDGTTPAVMAVKLAELGCVQAYTLDGGQTATIYHNGKVFNRVGYGSERPISDIIFFASAIPEK